MILFFSRSTIIDRAALFSLSLSRSSLSSISFVAFVARRRSIVALLKLAFLRRLGCGLEMSDRGTPEGRRLLHLFIVRLLYALEWGRALGPIIAFGRLIELFIPLSSSVRRLVAFHVRGRRRGVTLLVRVCPPPLVQQLYRVHNAVPITFARTEHLKECVSMLADRTICFRLTVLLRGATCARRISVTDAAALSVCEPGS